MVLIHRGGGLGPSPHTPLINPKIFTKLAHFSVESKKATNLWLIETFTILFQKSFYSHIKIASFRVITSGDPFSLGKIQTPQTKIAIKTKLNLIQPSKMAWNNHK